MMQKPWFKAFIWFISTFFFFLASMVLISELKPGPTDAEVMRFMEGMMSAMERSLMGVAMGIEGESALKTIIVNSSFMLVPITLLSIAGGVVLRILRRGDKNAS